MFTFLNTGMRLRIKVKLIISFIAAVAKMLKSTESTEKCIPYDLKTIIENKDDDVFQFSGIF